MGQVRPLKLQSSPQLAWSVALIACALAAWGWFRHIEPPPAVEHADKSAKTVAQVSAEPVHQEEIKALDDGMYVSPTAGPPLDLKYLARGTQGVIALRPAELLRHPEGCKLLEPDISGGFAKWMRYILPQVSGTTLGNIELLLIGEKSNDSHYCQVLYFREPVPMAELIAKKEWHAQTVDSHCNL